MYILVKHFYIIMINLDEVCGHNTCMPVHAI